MTSQPAHARLVGTKDPLQLYILGALSQTSFGVTQLWLSYCYLTATRPLPPRTFGYVVRANLWQNYRARFRLGTRSSPGSPPSQKIQKVS